MKLGTQFSCRDMAAVPVLRHPNDVFDCECERHVPGRRFQVEDVQLGKLIVASMIFDYLGFADRTVHARISKQSVGTLEDQIENWEEVMAVAQRYGQDSLRQDED